jgi:hypothetical protein
MRRPASGSDFRDLSGFQQVGIAICQFESSHSSQAVRHPQSLPIGTSKTPANCGLFQFNGQSLGPRFGRLRGGIAESLWPHAEIFPILGDDGRRLGSILTAWWARQSNSHFSQSLCTGTDCDAFPLTLRGYNGM